MERRLLTFFIASTAFFMVYISLRTMFAPPVDPALDNPAQVQNEVDEPAALADLGVENDESASDEAEGGEETEVKRPTEPEWTTLGSMDPTSGYFMLITLNSRGAGIERIEITEREENRPDKLKYRRVDVRHGYLGYLSAEPASDIDGVRVRVVGPGTPAALAGIQVGDVIVSIDGQPVRDRESLDNALLESKPSKQVVVSVVRGDSTNPVELTATLTEHPLDLVRLADDGGIDKIEGNLSRLSCLLTLAQVNRKSIAPNNAPIARDVDPTQMIWESKSSGEEGNQNLVGYELPLSAAEMKQIGGEPILLKRSYAVSPGSYVVDMDLEIVNKGKEEQDLAYRLEGANGITLEGWWYSNKISPHFTSGAAARDIVYKTASDGHELVSGYALLKEARSEPKSPYQTIFAPDSSEASKSLAYIGVDAQYFTVAYIPPTDQASTTSFARAAAGIVADAEEIPKYKDRAVNSTFFVDSATTAIPAGGSLRQNLQMFAGPKRPELLEKYGLGDTIYYGWFGGFSILLGKLLHILAGIFGNYGVAIILLTVIVRGCMFPLSRKAAVNAQKMQELAPELKKITEKHKDDLEARMKAQRELQKRVGFNPMAGCLPMFLQLPIFIGLYRALSVDIELRQQPFIPGIDWASNLAGPDMFSYWGDWLFEYMSGRGTGWLGPYFNILPVIVVGLFLLQQKLFMPPATDEQTAMTQKMMNFMTLGMGLLFFRVPAGLCLYFITSSLWGICERVLVKKTLPKTSHFDSTLIEGSAKPTEKKAETGSLADRIRNQISPPEPEFDRPNKRKRPKKK
ncbi:Membrane protein insertase YidC [Rubripirellula amarantea]|uniref:Membrane protein insertase YidC n=1 Tax=Rubripirellula amarantea TaxID=2527999 RepID=A0A5C5WQ32_9BACT|nr:YidC/Oxa1 family insertase periplasmic-domain containing protein [Rubripirellula amarantea]TWT52798.1 Membrane protein insertase YidC [Rubripirellula amarantea]